MTVVDRRDVHPPRRSFKYSMRLSWVPHRELSTYVFGAALAELSKVEACEEVLARAQDHGTEGEVQLVDETGA